MRRRQNLVLVVVVLFLVAPAVLDRDSFPLSIYPMYAQSRGDVVAISTATGVSLQGEQVRLSLDLIGASDDPLIVAALVRDAVRGGPGDVDSLCRRIAERAAGPEREVELALDQVLVVTERHNAVDRAAGRASLVSQEVHGTCPVPPDES